MRSSVYSVSMRASLPSQSADQLILEWECVVEPKQTWCRVVPNDGRAGHIETLFEVEEIKIVNFNADVTLFRLDVRGNRVLGVPALKIKAATLCGDPNWSRLPDEEDETIFYHRPLSGKTLVGLQFSEALKTPKL